MVTETFNTPRGDDLDDLFVLSGQEPALLVDPAKSALEAANAAGRRLLGLREDDKLPFALDNTMPALRGLCGLESDAEGVLEFWVRGRLVSLACGQRAVRDASGRRLVRITPKLLRTHGEAAPPAAPNSPAAEKIDVERAVTAAADPAALPVRRDDRETLREIARRIREGQLLSRNGRLSRIETSGGETDAPSPSTGTLRAAGEPLDRAALAKVAHELKTPLSAIMAAAEIMRDERLGVMQNARYLGYAGDIHDSAQHALAVVNEMLAQGAHHGRLSPIDLIALAETAVTAMQPLAAGGGVSLAFESEEEVLDLVSNATAVRQILFNLVNNALKFTPQGGDVRVVAGYLDDGSVFLLVRDTGEGMSEAEITRAFFSDASQGGGKRRNGGYGLGLPIVRELAESLGAALEADSAPGKGTTVFLVFPSAHTGGS